MNRAIKWGLIAVVCLVVLVFAGLLIIPKFVNVQQYKPQIEKRIAEATGRRFLIGDDLHLSLFPWAGVSFSNLLLGNPPGFEQKDFVTVESFAVQVKLIPLLFKDIQIKRFTLKGARIVFEKLKDGRVSWDFSKKPSDQIASEVPPEKQEPSKSKPAAKFSLKSLAVKDFAITEAAVL
ncbi:MAG: AsmA family protein, partial [Proteobacteria bacterium]|nr:AsmA family protein [Pseudomonadota bacterium]